MDFLFLETKSKRFKKPKQVPLLKLCALEVQVIKTQLPYPNN